MIPDASCMCPVFLCNVYLGNFVIPNFVIRINMYIFANWQYMPFVIKT